MQDSRFERTADMIWIDSLRTGMWSNLLKKHTDFLLLYMIQSHEYTRRNSQFVSSPSDSPQFSHEYDKKAPDKSYPEPLLNRNMFKEIPHSMLAFWSNDQCREKRKDDR